MLTWSTGHGSGSQAKQEKVLEHKQVRIKRLECQVAGPAEDPRVLNSRWEVTQARCQQCSPEGRCRASTESPEEQVCFREHREDQLSEGAVEQNPAREELGIPHHA